MYLLTVEGIVYDSILLEEDAKCIYVIMKLAGLNARINYKKNFLG